MFIFLICYSSIVTLILLFSGLYLVIRHKQNVRESVMFCSDIISKINSFLIDLNQNIDRCVRNIHLLRVTVHEMSKSEKIEIKEDYNNISYIKKEL